MNIDEKTAEEMRLMYRHLYWATKHMANIYNAVKPEEKPPLGFDPQQLSLPFEQEEDKEAEQ